MHRRRGFTLVELLVAMALVVFMMLILSEAFSVGLDSFRRLKAVGDMSSRMRSAITVLRADLMADHFEGKKRVSDPNFWAFGPPDQGFFRIFQGSPSVMEDTDLGGYGIPSTRAVDHILHMTVKKRGNSREDFFLADVPLGSPLLSLGSPDARYQNHDPATLQPIPPLTSQWAEVAYFLRPTGDTAGATPLYGLYRRQRVLVPNSDALNRGTGTGIGVLAADYPRYLEVSCRPQGAGLHFNGPLDITIPQRRLGMGGGTYPRIEDDMAAFPGGPDLAAADLLLHDVISLEVTVLLENGDDFVDLYHPSVLRFDRGSNPLFPRSGPRVFDTWTSRKDSLYDYTAWDRVNPLGGQRGDPTAIPLYQDGNGQQIRIVAVKITLRVWDVKTQQARQVSLIQDM